MMTTDEIPELCKSNINSFFGGLTAGILKALGVRELVMSPGSRSTPLVVGFTQTVGMEVIPILDERSAAFFALGLAQQKGRPVALLCSSATAVANFYPAVIEASYGRVPLIVLTADRPAEGHECYDRQTMDQEKVYGHFPRYYFNLPVPEPSTELIHSLRRTLVHAYERSLAPTPGPVHLNFPFREPLAPTIDPEFPAFLKSLNLPALLGKLTPPVQAEKKLPLVELQKLKLAWENKKGLIIAGPQHPPVADQEAFAQAVGLLSEKLGFPVLAEGLSSLRNYKDHVPHLISKFDLILRNEALQEELNPEVVIHIGPLPVSKVLRAWLMSLDAEVYMIDPYSQDIDCLQRPNTMLRTSIEALAPHLPGGSAMDLYYAQRWLELEGEATAALDNALETLDAPFEGKVAWLLSKFLPENAQLFVANSTPMRDVEFFWNSTDKRIMPFANRGLNGIDGTLSSALGVAHRGQPTYLLTGDLAFLHDTNGFLINNVFQGNLTIVLINNDGGGIFEFLPVSQFDQIFERYMATPQKVSMEKLVAAYDVEYANPKSWEDFQDELARETQGGIRLIEFKTDRKHDVAFIKQLFSKLSKQLTLQSVEV